VLAEVWDVKSRDKTGSDDLEKEIDEKRNDHNKLVYIKKQMPAVISNRDFLSRAIWKRAEGGGFVVVTAPEESTKRPANEKNVTEGEFVVRAKYPSILSISPTNSNETKLKYVIHPDAGGRVPQSILNSYIGSTLVYVTEIQEYFAERRGMSDYDKADGRALGYRRECPTPTHTTPHLISLRTRLARSKSRTRTRRTRRRRARQLPTSSSCTRAFPSSPKSTRGSSRSLRQP
jgi:hypothetical protein